MNHEQRNLAVSRIVGKIFTQFIIAEMRVVSEELRLTRKKEEKLKKYITNRNFKILFLMFHLLKSRIKF